MPYFDARWQRPETLQAIFDQISDAIFFFDKNLYLTRANKSGEQLFGSSAEEMIGKPCWQLFGFAAGDPNQGVRPQDAPPDAGQAWCLPAGIVRLRMDHGVERRVIIRTMELLDQSGGLEAVVAIVQDITDRPVEAESGRPGASPADGQTVHSGFLRRANRYHPVVIRNRRVAAVAGALFLIFLVVFVGGKVGAPAKQLSPAAMAEKEKREAAVRFNAMTPAQHIERAKLALRPGAGSDVIADGLRHLKVIPASAPEAGRAKLLQKDLVRAANLAAAQNLIDSSVNAEVSDGMEKLRRAGDLIDSVVGQNPKDRVAAQLSRAAQNAAEQLAVRNPKDFASAETKLVDFTWEKGGFGTVMMANFTIRNDSPIDVADLKIRCEHSAQSGVVLDDNDGTAFGIVRAHSTKRIPNINMGLLSEQVGTSRTTKTDCEILGLKLASESETFSSSR